jgi:hypothetical protein
MSYKVRFVWYEIRQSAETIGRTYLEIMVMARHECSDIVLVQQGIKLHDETLCRPMLTNGIHRIVTSNNQIGIPEKIGTYVYR